MSPDRNHPSSRAAVVGFDHVALPMEHTEAMSTFYKNLGMEVVRNEFLVQVYVGSQMINFHRPELWQTGFSLRAPAARPPCGDLCFVWSGSQEALRQALEAAGAVVEEGPVERQGGRKARASSIYSRDPDGNLLEFMTYPNEDSGAG
jgi:catechol 2,3-dioxygenase-like lactoylglutathione lyase family enzyme